jgi:mono/diheme cytochrome c family protein
MKKILIAVVGVIVLIQFIPYGRDHSNPEVVAEPQWDKPQTRQFFMRACGDCHSHETKWPFYAHIAPVSWLVQHDVDEGREHFNISMWGQQKKNEADEAAEEFREGEMPLWFYTMVHSEAKLSEVESQQLLQGLINTFGEEEHKKEESERSE